MTNLYLSGMTPERRASVVARRLDSFRQTAGETFSEFCGDPRERRDRLAMLDAWKDAQASGDASRIREVEDSILTY